MPREGEQERQKALLRLASARRRLRAILSEIGTLEGSDFPHPDGEDALADIKSHFLKLLARTDNGDMLSVRTTRQLCMDVAVESEQYLPVLGFLLRSTNVRNAFELYDPLRSIVSKTISSGARLIISSEWDFIPFTYPMNLDVLPSYVLVGGPASESANPLVIPLAGHEIGHSAWKHHNVTALLEDEFTRSLEGLAAKHTDEARTLEEYRGPDYIGDLREIGFRQVEEIYCDCFGLFLFGEAYAYAYEYYMFPGGSERSIEYPSDEDRIAYLREAAAWRGIELPADIFEGWKSSSDGQDSEPEVELLVDGAAKEILPSIFRAVDELLNSVQAPRPDQTATGEIAASLARSVPHPTGGNLADIIAAGWRCIRQSGGLGDPSNERRAATLNEVMLKTIEVAEYYNRVGNA